MRTDVLIVGGGIAGLSAARALSAAGRQVVVLDKGRKPGGRCATRNVDGQPVDYGPAFVHATTQDFVALLHHVPATLLPGWPKRVDGEGQPCQPASLRPNTWRFAYAEGLDALPKFLSAGVDLRTNVRVERIRATNPGWTIDTPDASYEATVVLLTVPVAQLDGLIGDITDHRVESLRALAAMVNQVPCLTSIYRVDSTDDPGFDMMLPRGDDAVHSIVTDSAKRAAGAKTTFVVQARPSWSVAYVDTEPSMWGPLLREAAAKLVPMIGGAAIYERHHRWRYARLDGAPTPVTPPLVDLGQRWLGLAGEGFDRRGGVEGAWRSGVVAARRIDETLEEAKE